MNKMVQTSYRNDDVEILLQDIKGKVPVLDTREREKLNQSGVHYSEMLPLEYIPTQKYMDIYLQSLGEFSYETAVSVKNLSDKIINKKGESVVLVSLARAGTPVGILVKRYLKHRYNIHVPHYSISIIRGKGIDVCAMKYITDKHHAGQIQFIDGWIGKGAITRVLKSACNELVEKDPSFKGLDDTLGVLSDPAHVTDMYGTRQDFLIPSACLNATVSGLVSRTVKTKTMTDDEFHGGLFYEEFIKVDQSYKFIDEVCSHFGSRLDNCFDEEVPTEMDALDVVTDIANRYNVNDINKVKPGIGETTRVLLRRIPDRVIISNKSNTKYLEMILQLCDEKEVPVEKVDLELYGVCGIIKDVSDL